MKLIRVKYFHVLLLLLIFSAATKAQIYLPIDTANLSLRKDKSLDYTEFKKKYIVDFKKNYSGKDKSYIIRNYTKQTDNFKEDLEGASYVFEDNFDQLVDSIVNLIYQSNSKIPQDLKFYISRDISLNAICMGDRTFIINMGAFYFLNNENELAAMISHEIGHLMLEHGLKSMQVHYKAEKVDAKANLAEIKSGKYNKGSKALEKYKALLYANKSLNRRHEEEADSLGFIFYKNAGFTPFEYINSYKLAARYDSIKPMGLKEDTYRNFFDLKDMPFKDSWLIAEDFSNYDYTKIKEEFDEDSLRSHPEMEVRIKKLQSDFPELNDSISQISSASVSFLNLQQIAEYEQIPSLIINEEYGFGIYLCLLRLQENADNDYYKALLGNLFMKIYDARKAYLLNRYLDHINPEKQSESYQLFLSFMWNLNMKEIKIIADYYSTDS